MNVTDGVLPPLAALDSVASTGLAHNGDVGLGVAGVVDVASGSDGDESGNQELKVSNNINTFNLILIYIEF